MTSTGTYVALGLAGAASGYFLLRPKIKGPWAALIGAAVPMGLVYLFRPGGLLRKETELVPLI
jgi:hypothetical protein